MSARITPTFLLKGLDFNRVVSDYQSGVFNRQPTCKPKIKISQTNMILSPEYGADNHSGIFRVKDRNNHNVIIATTNHSDFETFTKSGGTLTDGGRCDFCKRDFTTTSVGYPVAYQEDTILVGDDPKNAKYKIIYIFWTEGKFCTFECAHAYVKRFLSLPADFRDTTLRSSEQMLKLLHKLTYPKAGPLKPAQDPRLLYINGGSLTEEQWKDQKHEYIRTDRILMIPAKVEYFQQNFHEQRENVNG